MEGWVPAEATIRLAAFLVVFGGMAVFALLSPRLVRPEMTGALKSRRWFTNLAMVLISSVVLLLVFPAAAGGVPAGPCPPEPPCVCGTAGPAADVPPTG